MQHEVGTIVEGKVTGITKFGAFVELEGGSVGMVHISEISQSYVNDISDHLKEQQIVKVKILNIGEDGKISLSIKRALPPAPGQNGQSFRGKEGGGRPAGNRPQSNGGNRNPSSKQGGGNRSGSAPRPYTPRPAATPSGNASFEDMLSRFMKQSDEKMSGMKQPERRRAYQKKDSRDYE